jgi:hypothetical protein
VGSTGVGDSRHGAFRWLKNNQSSLIPYLDSLAPGTKPCSTTAPNSGAALNLSSTPSLHALLELWDSTAVWIAPARQSRQAAPPGHAKHVVGFKTLTPAGHRGDVGHRSGSRLLDATASTRLPDFTSGIDAECCRTSRWRCRRSGQAGWRAAFVRHVHSSPRPRRT